MATATRCAPPWPAAPAGRRGSRSVATQVGTGLTGAERFLAGFHDARPGITSAAYGVLAADCGGQQHTSSYHALAATVPAGAATVLDLACGDGHLLALLQASSTPQRRLLGADLSAGELALARRRLGAAAEFSQCRAQQLPFANGSIDQVLCHMALMLMDDLDAVLGEVLRVLAPAGRFAFVIGARPPTQPAYDAYIAQLMSLRAVEPGRHLALGDRRLRDEAGIRQALSTRFGHSGITPITLQRRRTPAQVWDWVDGMYDLHMARPEDRPAFRDAFLAELGGLCDADGCLLQTDRMNLVVATAA